MFRFLLPRETSFFDYFERHAAVTLEGARAFAELAEGTVHPAASSKRITELEHEADVITHQCVEALHKTFITPIDRWDIHRLISRMDDIMDLLEAAAERLLLYELTEMPREIHELSKVLVTAMLRVQEAVHGLRNQKNAERVQRLCIEINRLENEADTILRIAIARIFRQEKDPITIIKWKEIFEILESATDRCEDVAEVIEGVVLEHA